MRAPDPTTIDNRYRGPRLTEPSQPLGGISSLTPDPEFQKTHIPTYSGNSEYGSLLNDYYQSNMFDRDAYFNVSPIQPTVSFMNPLFGGMGPGQMGQMGNFNDYLKQQYQMVRETDPQRIKRKPEDIAKRGLIREAYYKMGFGNQPGQQLLGPDENIMQPFTGDPTETAPPGSPGPDTGFGPSNMQPILTPVNTPATTGPGYVDTTSEYSNLDTLNPNYIPGSNPFSPTDFPLFGEQEQQPGFVGMPTDNFADNTDFFNNMHSSGQQPTGGFDSKVFANELLTGIGDLFKQHFPDSAQMAFNNSNQPQSQIEQPIQDATTFDMQPQQNTAYNPFSVNTIGGAFGGGY